MSLLSEYDNRTAWKDKPIHGVFHTHEGLANKVNADRVLNMVSKSLVLLLRPHSESDYALLLDLYQRFDSIVRLPYALTPHITLAYFRPGRIDGDRLGAAVEQVQIQKDHALSFCFTTEALTAQFFRDMQTYL